VTARRHWHSRWGSTRERDRAIRDVWPRLEQLGVRSPEGHVPSIRPRLSLTATDDADGLRPGTWLPHCTLSMGVPADALAEALATYLASPLPLPARLRAAALTDFLTGATTPL
jgi:hypothetical protein